MLELIEIFNFINQFERKPRMEEENQPRNQRGTRFGEYVLTRRILNDIRHRRFSNAYGNLRTLYGNISMEGSYAFLLRMRLGFFSAASSMLRKYCDQLERQMRQYQVEPRNIHQQGKKKIHFLLILILLPTFIRIAFITI